MKSYALRLRYVYTFYNFGDIADCDAFDDVVEILDTPHRFTLHQQEDASFIVSELKRDYIGNYVVLTFPNKDNLVIHENDEVELAYDEYFSSMGDDNHNVYEGTAALQKSEI